MPQLVGERVGDAQAVLAGLGLAARPRQVPAPGVTPGLVVGQSPSASTPLPPHHAVALSVAELPRWRALAALTGHGGTGRSATVQIRGVRWRVVASVSYGGVCGWLPFLCSAPQVTVQSLADGRTVAAFQPTQGGGQTRLLDSGPGAYRVAVASGSGSARWSLRIEDDY